MSITFITGNKNKLLEMNQILNFPIASQSIDLPELQGTTKEIAIAKCKQAVSLIKSPVFVEDTCLIFNAFKTLPGPYIKHFLHDIGTDGLVKLLDAFPDKTAKAVCTIAYTKGKDEQVHVFEGVTEGRIEKGEGDGGFGWDSIFVPNDGPGCSYAGMVKEEKNKISHRFRAVQLFQSFINEQEAAGKFKKL